MKSPSWRCWRLALLLAFATSQGLLESKAIEPQLSGCTLQVGNKLLKPVEILTPAATIYRVGNNRFFLRKDTVERPVPRGNKPAWTARSDDGARLYWLGADEHVAYLGGYDVQTDGSFRSYEFPARVRRLDLGTGQWLPDLPIRKGSPEGYDPERVIGVLTNGGDVIVLTGFAKKSASNTGDSAIDLYNICLFKAGKDTPIWSKQYAAANEKLSSEANDWGSIPSPFAASSGLDCLSWLGARLLVCPDPVQPVLCLNPDTGSEIWRLERLWEFQRGVRRTGRGILRFGEFEPESSNERLDAERKIFDDKFQCGVIGGPAVLPLDFARSGHRDSHSAFLAVAQRPVNGPSSYFSECLLYELGDDGDDVVSMLILPQNVVGSQFCVRDGGVIWKCQDDTFVKIRPSRDAFRYGGSGLCDLVWARRVQFHNPEPWMASGKSEDPVAFGASFAYCLPDGGYVLRKGDTIYHLPFIAVDLSTGMNFSFVLNVPFKETFPLPTRNFSTESYGDGLQYIRSLTSEILAITQLRANSNELEITLTSASQKSVLNFDVGTALRKAESITAQNPLDPMAEARATVKLISRSELTHTLSSLVGTDHETDALFMKALLEAGADPKYSYSNGWTALMDAASFGTAEMVDILIAAGSDVNATLKDQGETPLLWAAMSGREAKLKVRSLLKAGADPKRVDNDGDDALMNAAGYGHLDAMEYLLAAGFPVTNRNLEGNTVLMSGAWSKNWQIVSALLQAGADKNTFDNEDMTALMQAADGGDSEAAVIQVLLNAGADPNLKDKKGRTALQIAEAHNDHGFDEVIKLLKPVTSAK